MTILDARLNDLSLLKDGWLDGNDGYEVKPEAMLRCRQTVQLLREKGYPEPWAGPSLDDPGIHLTWRNEIVDITCEFMNTGQMEIYFIEWVGEKRDVEQFVSTVEEMVEVITRHLTEFGLISNQGKTEQA